MSGVLVVVEQQRSGGLAHISLEALAAGQQLAKLMDASCSAAVLGSSVASVAEELSTKSLAHIYALEHPLLQPYTADGFTVALEQLVRRLAPAFVLFPHTYQARDFVPALATRFRQVLLSDLIAIRPGPVFVRQIFQGKLNAEYRHSGDGPCFLSIQAGSFRVESLQPGTAPMEHFAIELAPDRIRTKPGEPFRESAQSVDLASAPLIVSVGRGIAAQENIPLVQALADALGAELAGSRPVCDAGWLPIERQVGSSGHTVAPKLYLAIGISGAIQHLVGMKASKTVIAINKDENAPIFEVADYGVVGDLFEIVPELTRAVQAVRGGGA